VSPLLLYNARVLTMAEPQIARAVLVADGRIVAVGGPELAEGPDHPGVQRVDLAGRCVTPGLIDSHLHLRGLGDSLSQLDLAGVADFGRALELVRGAAAELWPNEWLTGGRFDRNLWNLGRLPDRHDLDGVAPATPVLLSSKDGHSLWANSRAIEIAGVGPSTAEPAGGRIYRDADGYPVGLFAENACELIRRAVPEPGQATRLRSLRRAIDHLQRLGVTCVHEMSAEGQGLAHDLRRLRDERGHLGLRVRLSVGPSDVGGPAGDEDIRLVALKLWIDGALGSQTALMEDPYEGDERNRGVQAVDDTTLHRLLKHAASVGLACWVHAIGDQAVRLAIEGLESAGSPPIGLQHRIEHAQCAPAGLIERMARLGVAASVQPIHQTQDIEIAERYWGRRSRWAYPFASMRRAGIPLVFGSDAPVEDADPRRGLWAAVTRQREDGTPAGGWFPEERIGIEAALRAYTVESAQSVGDGGQLGAIVPGAHADLVVWSSDVERITIEGPDACRAVATCIGGRWVHSEIGDIAVSSEDPKAMPLPRSERQTYRR